MELELLVSDAHGVYIPKLFIEGYIPECMNVKEEDRVILLSGPDHEDYWETWDDVLNYCEVTNDKGEKFTLYQDGDLWAVPEGYIWPENE